MPRGVAKDFIQLLSGAQRSGRMRVIMLFVLALILFIPAWLLWSPFGAVIHGTVLLVGLGIGALFGWRTSRGYEDSMRGTWNQWMKLAPACENVPELARKVRGASTTFRVAWIAALLTLLWAAELGLLVLAFMEAGSAAFSIPVIAANALFVGGLAGYQVRLLTWTRTFRHSLDEMVRAGEIGVWGASG